MPPFKTVRVVREPAKSAGSSSTEKPAKVYTQSHSIAPPFTTKTKKAKEGTIEEKNGPRENHDGGGDIGIIGIREIIAKKDD